MARRPEDYANRKTAEAPYINIAVRRGADARLIDRAVELAPTYSRTRLALVAMRLGLEAMTADEDVLREALAKFGLPLPR